MFPISDPSRADDIRMRRRRAAWLLAGIALVPLLLFNGHRRSLPGRHDWTDGDADLPSMFSQVPLFGRHNRAVAGAPLPAGRRDATALSATGTSLSVMASCAGPLAVVPQGDLRDRVFVSVAGARPAAATRLALTGGPNLTLTGDCGRGNAGLVIQAPAAMPLTLSQTGASTLRLGAFSGPVRVRQRGSGDTVIDAAGPLDVEKAGAGDLSVGLLRGPLHLSQFGSGDTAVARAETPAIDASLTGSGDLSIPEGHIGRLAAVLRGHSDLSIEAEIGDAAVDATGHSDVRLPHVKGRLDRHVPGE